MTRPGGGGYDLTVVQDWTPTDLDSPGSFLYYGEPVVELQVTEGIGTPGGSRHAELRLTTGEARTLAALLISRADLVDLT